MTSATARPSAGPYVGIYTPQDAAKYIAVTTPPDVGLTADSRTIARWVRKGVGDAEYSGVAARYVFINFDGLISMRVISALRASGVSWPAIRKAEQWLKEHTGAEKPFASAALWQGGGDIFSELDARLVNPSRAGQGAFDILREHIIPVGNLRYGSEGDAPEWWEPIKHVWLNPKIQFGSPCVAGTRIPTATLHEYVTAGETRRSILDDYEITDAQLKAALDWESRLTA